MPPPPQPQPLVDELEEEVLLRFPPEDPAALIRAALVCKRWRGLVTGPGFRRRFREFHRTPPMLGMFCNSDESQADGFVPTTAFLSHHADLGGSRVLDARHGRVVLRGGDAVVVWDPITDEDWMMPCPLQYTGPFYWTATVLCSAAAGGGGCDHLDCHRRPFIVVLVASAPRGPDVVSYIYTHSSDAAAWSKPICSQRPRYIVDFTVRSALVGNTLYFGNLSGNKILKYNVQLRQVSWIRLPSSVSCCRQESWMQLPSSVSCCRLSALTTTEGGGLQLGIQDEEKLYIWSTKDADGVDARWEQNRVIELNTLLPEDAESNSLSVVGSTDGLGTIFVSANNVAYAIDLKTYKVKKVYEDTVDTIIPYTSFYTPALEADGTGEGPGAGG